MLKVFEKTVRFSSPGTFALILWVKSPFICLFNFYSKQTDFTISFHTVCGWLKVF